MQPDQKQNETSGWSFVANDQPAANQAAAVPSKSSYSWSASEFIAYHKSFGWYASAILAIVLIGALVYVITRGDIISTLSVVVFGILFLVYAGRKPRVLQYSIDSSGLHIGEKTYPFGLLRSFSVINEGSLRSIYLYPLKRFMPPISLYFEPQEETTIVELLGSYLPQEEKNQDLVDKLMHKIRF